MDITLSLLAFLLGAIITYFMVRSKLAALQTQLQNLEGDRVVALKQQEAAQAETAKLQEQVRRENSKVMELHAEVTRAENDIYHLKQKLSDERAELSHLRETFMQQFTQVSNQVLVTNAEHFRKASAENLEQVLSPLKERIKEFESKVEQTYEKTLKDTTSLKEQITYMASLNQQMSQDAVNLTKALRGEKKAQGNWGEYLLENLLEKSGLERDVHYRREQVLQHDDAKIFRPDVIIDLPDNKHLIIDSKVSLVAYDAYCNCEDEGQQQLYLKSHAQSIRNHYTDLSRKNYQYLHGIHSPDFVLMYIPIEPAFNLAIQQDRDLFLEALDRNIVFVTTSTLLATLRTVASVWKQESQKRNVLRIAEESGKLYDKFANFLEDLKDIGVNLDRSQQKYQAAMNKLSEGNGNLLKKVELLKKLGARTSKTMETQWLQNTSSVALGLLEGDTLKEENVADGMEG
ncbi:DNA recombination protein RmuC [Rufibacter glacialis]|uniref:DNA recombination protein RmuC n=1 Tax=Rufibacter glacialis TaxID=1259555 RepID=A0A5M8Q7E0_9BACT|nr:DNA recombination protein RmuC [Rufibacter glacialis]KAA6431807.1 DNA recombination protein RmuC [Rufibacter glacialis]GGK81409.1 DNA recombination protein RmuC [Rufibacter glacialis]